MPVHLLNREAFTLYLDALEPAANLTSLELESQASGASSCVLLARAEQRIRSVADPAEQDTRRLGVRGAANAA